MRDLLEQQRSVPRDRTFPPRLFVHDHHHHHHHIIIILSFIVILCTILSCMYECTFWMLCSTHTGFVFSCKMKRKWVVFHFAQQQWLVLDIRMLPPLFGFLNEIFTLLCSFFSYIPFPLWTFQVPFYIYKEGIAVEFNSD